MSSLRETKERVLGDIGLSLARYGQVDHLLIALVFARILQADRLELAPPAPT